MMLTQWLKEPAMFIELPQDPMLIAGGAFLLGWIVARILTGVVRRIMHRAKVESTLIGFATSMTFALLMTLVVISAVQKLGVPTTSFVAVVGAAGLAVGFALQGSLANFAAGVMTSTGGLTRIADPEAQS